MPIGAHVSIRGRIFDAIPRAVAIGCECLQIFVGSPRQWRLVHYLPWDLEEFRRRRSKAGLDPLVAHGSYLINLASRDPIVNRRSVGSLAHDLQVMDELGGLGVITHIGSAQGAPWRDARARIARGLGAALAESRLAMILLEGSAGGTIGGTFQELGDILDAAGAGARLGICLDSAHLFAAGQDLRTPRAVDAMVAAVDRTVGLRRLRALHLNDSKAALGSRLDRHENIGEGRIGRAGFRAILAHPALRELPGLIETPGFDREGPDRRNIETLKRLRTRAGQGAAARGRRPRPPARAGRRRSPNSVTIR